MRIRFLEIIFTLVIFSTNSAFAAWIDPQLVNVLDDSNNESVSALVFLQEQVCVQSSLADLKVRGASLAQRHMEIIHTLRDVADATQPNFITSINGEIASDRIRIEKRFWIANAMLVEVDFSGLESLKEHEDVAKVFGDYAIELIEPVHEPIISPPPTHAAVESGVQATAAGAMWFLGFDGSTALAAHLDSGVDGTHPAFADRWRGNREGVLWHHAWYDPVTNTQFPFDAGYHGTHTMGTIVGDDGQGNQIGMAPGAQWISAGVIDRVSLEQTITDALAALEWLIDPDGDPETMEDVPDVISNSWRLVPYLHGVPPCDETFWSAIDAAEAAGPVIIWGAGNEGPLTESIGTPADRITSEVNVLSVGSVDQNWTTVSWFSSRGPSGCDHQSIKPEVVAVGANVRSALPDGNYGLLSGTSMAAPHVAGAVLLLRDFLPQATPEDIKWALYLTAVDVGDPGEDNLSGMGRINVFEAALYLTEIYCDVDDDGYYAVSCGGYDCNDGAANIHPDAEEICDGLDNNCDQITPYDEIDHDTDGVWECAGDCAPHDGDRAPGFSEVCDGKDNDCDMIVPDDEIDHDTDGVLECAGDCAPHDGDRAPGFSEVCDGKDNDCDLIVPDDEIDHDTDGVLECDGDCAPHDGDRAPGLAEVCDGKDNDCDLVVPDDEIDHDTDGVFECAGDCDPQDGDRAPGFSEVCDGKDNDCDLIVPDNEIDHDTDGVFECAGDCAPLDGDRAPGFSEVCDGKDNDCDLIVPDDEIDHDADGVWECSGDCGPNDEEMYPGNDEDCEDEKDNDCNGLTDQDDSQCPSPDDDADDDDAVDDDSVDDDADDDDSANDDSANDDVADDDTGYVANDDADGMPDDDGDVATEEDAGDAGSSCGC